MWSIEEKLSGKRIAYVPNWELSGENVYSFNTFKEKVQYILIDNFRSYAKINITTPESRYTFKAGEQVKLPLMIINNYAKPITFGKNKAYQDCLVFCLFHEEEMAGEEKKLLLNGLTIKKVFKTNTIFHVPEKKGTYYLRISIQNGWLPPGINSRLIRMKVE